MSVLVAALIIMAVHKNGHSQVFGAVIATAAFVISLLLH